MKIKVIVGIAGYIASGKSEAGRYFKKLGALYIDADKVVDELYKPQNDCWRKIVSYFGRDFIKKNGEINRRKLAKFVFGDVNKLKILNALIHPLVTNEIRKMMDRCRENLIVIEASYFEKKHLLGLVDKIIWMDCDKKVLLKRAMKNSGITERMFEQILKVQVKPEKTDYVVRNNGSLGALHLRLKKIYRHLTSKVG